MFTTLLNSKLHPSCGTDHRMVEPADSVLPPWCSPNVLIFLILSLKQTPPPYTGVCAFPLAASSISVLLVWATLRLTEQCWPHYCPVVFSLQLDGNSFITQNFIDWPPLCPACLNSVGGIHIDVFTILETRDPRYLKSSTCVIVLVPRLTLLTCPFAPHWKAIYSFCPTNSQLVTLQSLQKILQMGFQGLQRSSLIR